MQDTLQLPQSSLVEFPTGRGALRTEATDAARTISKLEVRRILLPFDLSQSRVSSLRAVANFAARSGAAIHLLHVLNPQDQTGAVPKTSRSDDRMAEASERLLKHWARRVVPEQVRTFVSVRIGNPVDSIVSRAIATRADLIVMATRASSRQEWQRSTAERVSRLAPCPVLTIPEASAERWAYFPDEAFSEAWGTVLMPVDFSAAAEAALPCASAIAARKGAKLLLAHGADAGNLDIPEIHARLRSWARQKLNDASHCSTTVWPGGHSLFAILAEAIRSEAKLIVMPTRAQPWAERLRAGSITDGVLRQASCPVLSINENVSTREH